MYSIIELDVKNHLYYSIANDPDYKIENDQKFFAESAVIELNNFLRRQLTKLNSLITHEDVEASTVCAKFVDVIGKIKQQSFFTEDRLSKSIEIQKKLIESVEYLKSKDKIDQQSVEIISKISNVYLSWTTFNRFLLTASYIFNSNKFDFDCSVKPDPDKITNDLFDLAIETIENVLTEQENLLVYFDRDVIKESVHARTTKLRNELKEFDLVMWGQ